MELCIVHVYRNENSTKLKGTKHMRIRMRMRIRGMKEKKELQKRVNEKKKTTHEMPEL